ncbi:MAG: hypothetical protein DMG32_18205 [Acidobacteria bacterium]|nr:MAG: hypothetical protein DMG32_18205 [Acidobacteriota bacterium]
MSARSSSARTLSDRRSLPQVRKASPRSQIRAMARWLALIAITQQVSCGGNTGSNSAAANLASMPMVTVSLSPASAQIEAGATVQFLVNVQNASNPAVTWQVNGIPGGNSSVGTITPSGAATASYTAPASVSGALTVTVAAVLQADTTKFGSANVTINPLPVAKISISPQNANVVAGASLQFSAVVQNGPQAVIWEVNNIPGGSAMSGTITSSPQGSLVALYTAPALIPL